MAAIDTLQALDLLIRARTPMNPVEKVFWRMFVMKGRRLPWLTIACFLVPATVAAAGVDISGEDPKQAITVTIDQVAIDVVLENLRKHYGFEVSGVGNAMGVQAEPVTATLSGSLHNVIQRLLRNWNHMIVRSPDNKSGISKVMILNGNHGAPTGRAIAKDPKGKSSDAHLHALFGGQ